MIDFDDYAWYQKWISRIWTYELSRPYAVALLLQTKVCLKTLPQAARSFYHQEFINLVVVPYLIRDQQYNCSNYRAFRYSGQLLKIRDCPGDSGTVGAYEW